MRNITLEFAAPPPASTLTVEDCLPNVPISDQVFCTNELSLGFSVLAERDIVDGLLVVTLTGDGGPWCGALLGIVDRVELSAGTRTSVTVSAWQLPSTDDSATEGLAKGPPCPKTMTTRGLVEARLYDGVVPQPVRYEAFCCYVYTVVRP